MQPEAIHGAFAAILAQAAKLDPAGITRETRLREDLGLDSLTLIDVAVATEDRFGVRVPDDELERFETVGDAVDYVRQAGAA